jgi:hypothetical protein
VRERVGFSDMRSGCEIIKEKIVAWLFRSFARFFRQTTSISIKTHLKMVATHSSSSSSSTNKNTTDGKKDKSGKKERIMVASKAEVSGEKKLFTNSVRTPCTMAMFKKFYESATPIKSEEMENNTLKLVGPTCSTGELDSLSLLPSRSH